MTASSLQAALRAGADGLYALEAGTGLIIAHGSWPAREDFGRFIQAGPGITIPGTLNWPALTGKPRSARSTQVNSQFQRREKSAPPCRQPRRGHPRLPR